MGTVLQRRAIARSHQSDRDITYRHAAQSVASQGQCQRRPLKSGPGSQVSPPKPTFLGLSKELSPLPQPGVMVQPKLAIGQPGDRYEQEADRVAAQVVQQLNVSAANRSAASNDVPEVQQQPEIHPVRATPGNVNASQELTAEIATARGSGQPLAAPVRQPMEQAIGTDFSSVRVHTDARADALNRHIGARAFTTGQDVFFRRGEYQPGNLEGQKLLAHELTHVVQQHHTQSNNVLGQLVQRDVEIQYGDEAGTYTANRLRELLDLIARVIDEHYKGKKVKRGPVHLVNSKDKTYKFSSIHQLIEYMLNMGSDDFDIRDHDDFDIRDHEEKVDQVDVSKKVELTWEREKDKQVTEAQWPKLAKKLIEPTNYDRKSGEPGFNQCHFDDTKIAQWKLQADQELLGAGSVDRMHLNVEVVGQTIKVTVVKINYNTH